MLINYIKIALRNLRVNRTYTMLNMIGLSLGMSGVILIFLFLQNHLRTDRHQPNFDRLHRLVLNLHLDDGIEYNTDTSIPLAEALAMDYSQIEKVGFIKKIPIATISSVYNQETRRFTEKENVAFADQGFIEMFKFNLLEGSLAGVMKVPYAVVISEKLARKYFGKTDVTGRTLRLDNATDLRIAGVLKESQDPTDLKFDVYISLPTIKKIEPTYELDNFGWLSSRNQIFIRLTQEADVQSLENLIKANGIKYYADAARYYEHKLQPLSEVHFDERYGGKISRHILWILAVVGLFLLFIACINFVNLATAQALKRAKEIGVRKVLGSTRSQLFWQFMSETALITLFSAFVTLVLVALLLPLLNNWTHTQSFHVRMLFQFQIVFFWALTILFVILIAGFYPAVIISGFNPVAALKSRLGTKQIGGLNLRKVLIVVQLVIAQILIIGTLVLILQLRYFKNADLGFDQHAVVTVQLPNTNSEPEFHKSLQNDLMQFPDIKSVTYQHDAPTSDMGFGGQIKFDNRSEWEKFVIRERYGDENYLGTYKMRLLAGRNYVVRDSVTEFVVNVELMHKLGIKDPQKILGKMLNTGMGNLNGRIVGVVKSFHLKSMQASVEPCAIFAKPEQYKEIAVKLDTKDFGKSIKNIQKVWQQTYPEEVFSYQFVDEKITKFYEKEEQLTMLIRSFALIAILICCLGLYGMVSFMITQRTKEIGIRKVLGAGVESIVLLFGKEFFILVLAAFLIAAPVGWYFASDWLNNFAYHIQLGWWIPALGCLIVLVITLLTIGFKVIKAALMNPVKSLRAE